MSRVSVSWNLQVGGEEKIKNESCVPHSDASISLEEPRSSPTFVPFLNVRHIPLPSIHSPVSVRDSSSTQDKDDLLQ